jgi:hypothetical protein
MITSTTNLAEIVSTLPEGESRLMQIKLDALAAITDSMVNLYKDPYLAVVREYSTNARDAMIAAGRADEPITVMLPSSLDPTLTVADTGIGMSKDQVLDFYSQYGASDKRDSNQQAGTYGYGCKSGFAIAGQFVVIATQVGMQTVAIFYRDEHGVGIARLVSHTETDAPDGVTVKVPVEDATRMAQTAERFFFSWPEGTVLVDEEFPRSLRADALVLGPVSYRKLDKGLEWRERDAQKGIKVVMGHTAYPVDHHLIRRWSRFADAGTLYIDAEIGDIDIIPSRESVRDSEKTRAFIDAKMAEFTTALALHVQGLVAEQDSLYQAALTLKTWTPILHALPKFPDFSWLGTPVQTWVDLTLKDHPMRVFTRHSPRRAAKARLKEDKHGLRVDAGQSEKILVVTGVNLAGTTPAKLSDYAMEQGFTHVLLVEKASVLRTGWFKPSLPFVTVLSLVDYEAARRTAAKARRLANPPEPKDNTVRYDVLRQDGQVSYGVTLAELKGSLKLYWTRMRQYQVSTLLTEVGAAEDESVAVLLLNAQQREETAVKRFPGIQPVTALAEDVARVKVAAYTPEQRAEITVGIARREADTHLARKLTAHLDKITDPILADVVQKLSGTEMSEAYQSYREVNGAAFISNAPAWTAFNAEIYEDVPFYVNAFNAYPLLSALSRWSASEEEIKHAVIYINAIATERLSAELA